MCNFPLNDVRARDRKRRHGTLILAALALQAHLAGSLEIRARAQPDEAKAADLIGKDVVPKFGKFTLKVDGRVVALKRVLQGYTVERSDNNGLLLKSETEDVEGMASASDVVPLDEAEDFFTEQIRKNPNDGYSYLARAFVRSSYRQEYDLALPDLNEAIRLNPSVEAYSDRGDLWLSIKKDYDKAIADYDRAIQLDPNQWGILSNRGMARFVKQDYDRAIADFDQATRLDQLQWLVFSNRARAFLMKKDYDKAIADCDRAIQLDPNQDQPFGLRGAARASKKEYLKSIADFDQAIRLNPEDPNAHVVRGNVFRMTREYDKAITDFDEAIRLDPENATHYYWRSLSEFLQGPNANAVESMKEALTKLGWREKDSPYWAIQGYLAARRAGKLREARTLLDDFKAEGDTLSWPYPIIRYLRGEITAEKLLAAATDQDKRTESHCYVGLDLLLKNKSAAAKGHFLWVMERGNQVRTEYEIVQAELDRMNAAQKSGKKR